MSSPLISVVIPCFDLGVYLAEAVDSVSITLEQERGALAAAHEQLTRAVTRAKELRSSLDAQGRDALSVRQQLAELRQALTAANRQSGLSEAERGRLADERVRLLSDVDGLLRDIDAMRRSKSWRWSDPLRWLAGRLSRR